MNKVQFFLLFTQRVQRSDSEKRGEREDIKRGGTGLLSERPITERFLSSGVCSDKGTSVGSECNQPKIK